MSLRFDAFPVIGTEDNPRVNAKAIELIKAVRETGSLQRAAQGLNISYRHAWGMLRDWEVLLGHQILDTERGRGASLTRYGERLLRAERRFREATDATVRTAAAQFVSDLQEASHPGAIVRFSGSFDPAVKQLSQAVSEGSAAWQFDSVYCGSVEALICLHERQSEIAGFYVSPIQGAGSVAHVTLRKWLRPASTRLVRLAWREQGLLVAPEMAAEINGLDDLVRKGARFINRQRSSGTRMLFDQLLAKHGFYADQVAGYEATEFTNEKVGEAVHTGRAQVGFGLRVGTEALGLKFVPLTREAYYLAFRKSDQNAAWLQCLLGVLESQDFARRIQTLLGYWPATPEGILTPQEALPWYGEDGKEGS
ncbi:ModE molybdate transport repressor domain protein [compost metagenome]